MTPNEWYALLNPDNPWQHCYAESSRQAKDMLTLKYDEAPGRYWSTSELVQLLLPVNAMDPHPWRKRLFRALSTQAHHDLTGWYRLDEPRLIGGKMSRPKLWRRPDTVKPELPVPPAPSDAATAILRQLAACPHSEWDTTPELYALIIAARALVGTP